MNWIIITLLVGNFCAILYLIFVVIFKADGILRMYAVSVQAHQNALAVMQQQLDEIADNVSRIVKPFREADQQTPYNPFG